MADFDRFFPTLLKHEGGFVNDPVDPGGATNKGVTLATFKQCAQSLLNIEPTLANLKGLTDAQAATIYKALYWDKVCGDKLQPQELANIVFDFQVNAGANAARLLQRVLNNLGAMPQITVDGVIGRGTLAAIAKTDPQKLYIAYKKGRKDYYINLVNQRPALGKFLKGWLARVDSFPDQLRSAQGGD
ncbi:glycoside hydrolase family 108 protein [Luteibacter sp. NPDC031894]|uniref:glycoside hydrolase family 108 protein n=1 Tax=Luteibacter sp. NPDC031894 TaxID=3390572 RepID=UPI003D05E99C